MGGWRDTLKAEGPQEPIRKIRAIRKTGETVLGGGNSAYTAYSAYRGDTLTLPVDTLRPAPAMKGEGGDIVGFANIVKASRPLNDDVVELARREFKRLAKRLSRIMRPGYLKWTAENQPGLYREIGQAYEAFDTAKRVESLKAGRIAWRDYRRLMLAWGRLHVKAIKLHRLALKERKAA